MQPLPVPVCVKAGNGRVSASVLLYCIFSAKGRLNIDLRQQLQQHQQHAEPHRRSLTPGTAGQFLYLTEFRIIVMYILLMSLVVD